MGKINLGKAIRKARADKGLTQDDLAKQLHISRQAVSSWEIDKSVPSVEIILDVCKVLDLDFNEIVGKEGIKAEDVINYQLKKGLKKYLFYHPSDILS